MHTRLLAALLMPLALVGTTATAPSAAAPSDAGRQGGVPAHSGAVNPRHVAALQRSEAVIKRKPAVTGWVHPTTPVMGTALSGTTPNYFTTMHIGAPATAASPRYVSTDEGDQKTDSTSLVIARPNTAGPRRPVEWRPTPALAVVTETPFSAIGAGYAGQMDNGVWRASALLRTSTEHPFAQGVAATCWPKHLSALETHSMIADAVPSAKLVDAQYRLYSATATDPVTAKKIPFRFRLDARGVLTEAEPDYIAAHVRPLVDSDLLPQLGGWGDRAGRPITKAQQIRGTWPSAVTALFAGQQETSDQGSTFIPPAYAGTAPHRSVHLQLRGDAAPSDRQLRGKTIRLRQLDEAANGVSTWSVAVRDDDGWVELAMPRTHATFPRSMRRDDIVEMVNSVRSWPDATFTISNQRRMLYGYVDDMWVRVELRHGDAGPLIHSVGVVDPAMYQGLRDPAQWNPAEDLNAGSNRAGLPTTSPAS